MHKWIYKLVFCIFLIIPCQTTTSNEDSDVLFIWMKIICGCKNCPRNEVYWLMKNIHGAGQNRVLYNYEK